MPGPPGPLNAAPGPDDTGRMDTERMLAASERGTHLLFETSTIHAAYAQDPGRLRSLVQGSGREVEPVIDELLRQPTAAAGRSFIAELPPELQYLLVLLWFELVDGRTAERRVLH